ncbi:macrolide transporter subunit MacA [Candidatus Williamhamiltonella defendens]|uniref:Macrolide transporter subunit MacA n=2 Tax=Candidatus Williamhamiltonella defendens TaxID=138072 RepID=A0A2D3T178_9ENTR|nr:macrolide transporter subunit MacA [Candidatus Hamiltonella defensa]ACQ67294.1 ABC-type antimicrobial peptide transport system, membrane fusion [Candidatus Hamiltonella defensa 5AT (Acyrthosiphon pisum)]ATW22040.1 macrolide transporter subunit MacA [Candidatus Hamiltonella defensa]ATW29291.1 macrolide transporter subunit MacA [Candidatus Hamiltonella defensa]ATW31268.1 macrolide transporter subunit MacA [Candidatus Hamiltonella defensa]ATW33274.1 macrolide transporter subunit MacA [Candidat
MNLIWLKKLNKKVIVIPLILLMSGFFVIRFQMKPAEIQYKTVSVTQGDIVQSVLATGKLDALRKVDVGAQVSGQLQHLYVKIGDKVKQGQLLGMIDPQKAKNQIKEVAAALEDLNAQSAQAEAEKKLTLLTLNRQKNLARLKLISPQDIDQTETDLAVRKAKIEMIKAQINRTRISLDTANLNLEYTKISAPMSGEVVQITTLEGQTVIATQQVPNILTLADMSTMLVNTQVSEADIIHLKPGLKISFTILGDPNKHFEGVLKDIQPTPESINDAIFYSARFEVPNSKGLLRLKMTAQVSIQLAEARKAMLMPLSALGNQIDGNRYQVSVLVKDKDNKNQEETREVTIGIRNNLNVQILSGLKLGEKVIISRFNSEDI